MEPESFENRIRAMGGSAESVFDEAPFRSCHASTLAQLPDGRLVCAWFGGTSEGDDDVGIWMAERDATGWSDVRLAAKVNDTAHWNPVLFYDDEQGLVLFFKVGPHIPAWRTYWMRSPDGRTWTEPVELVPGDEGGRGPVRAKPIRLSDGAWLAGASTELGSWRPFADRSEDRGATWTRSADFEMDPKAFAGKGAIQPTLWESAPGHVHALMRTTAGWIARADSTDGGRTWSPARLTDLPNPSAGIDALRLDDGRVLLIYNPVRKGRTPISLAVSEDNGETWRTVAALETAPGEYSYPAMIATDDGIAISYTWQRRKIRSWVIPLAALDATETRGD